MKEGVIIDSNNARLILCSRLVKNGKIVINLDNIRNHLNEVNKLIFENFTDQTDDDDIIDSFRNVYKRLTYGDFSLNNEAAKDCFNLMCLPYAYVCDRNINCY